MILELGIATLMVLLTALIHGFGLLGLGRMLRIEEAEEKRERVTPTSPRALLFMTLVILGLMALHAIEIWAYALLFLWLGALEDLRTAVYFSTITYGTVGYDSEGFAPAWQLVAAIESVNGVILCGWSIAFLVTATARLGRR